MLQYAGVTLGYQLTEGFEQSPERDPSGTDILYQKFRVTARGIIGPNVTPALVGETPSVTMARVRHLLCTDRRRLVVAGPDGQVMIDTGVNADGSDRVDDANGPRVVSCTLSKLTEGSYWLVLCIETRLRDCNNGGNGLGYLSNRWETTRSIDLEQRTTVRRTGELILSSRDGLAADSFAGLVTPGIEPGFRRVRADYTEDRTGLVYRYSFEDRELMRPPPWPAIKMTGRMVETTPLPGAVRTGEFSIQLTGPKGTSHRDLLDAGIRVGMSRALLAGAVQTDTGRFLIGGAIEESLNDDEIKVGLQMRWQMKATSARTSGNSLITRLIRSAFGVPQMQALNNLLGNAPPVPNAGGQDMSALATGYAGWVGADLPGSDPARGIAPPTRGTAPNIKTVAAALQDPCAVMATLRGGNFENELVATNPDGSRVSVVTNAPHIPDDVAGQYGDDQDAGCYDRYVVTSHFTRNENIDVMPSTLPGEPGQRVRYFNPTAELRVEFSASRVGEPPVLPDPVPAGPEADNFQLIRTTYSPDQVDVAGDGVTPKFSVSGTFFYKVIDPGKMSVVAPVPPFLKLTLAPEARKVVRLLDPEIIWYGGAQVNPALHVGTETKTRTGGGTTVHELRGGPRVDV